MARGTLGAPTDVLVHGNLIAAIGIDAQLLANPARNFVVIVKDGRVVKCAD